ncbi:hypothetical protein B0H17DRAFT_1254520, partial [Mycena rosella]
RVFSDYLPSQVRALLFLEIGCPQHLLHARLVTIYLHAVVHCMLELRVHAWVFEEACIELSHSDFITDPKIEILETRMSSKRLGSSVALRVLDRPAVSFPNVENVQDGHFPPGWPISNGGVPQLPDFGTVVQVGSHGQNKGEGPAKFPRLHIMLSSRRPSLGKLYLLSTVMFIERDTPIISFICSLPTTTNINGGQSKSLNFNTDVHVNLPDVDLSPDNNQNTNCRAARAVTGRDRLSYENPVLDSKVQPQFNSVVHALYTSTNQGPRMFTNEVPEASEIHYNGKLVPRGVK